MLRQLRNGASTAAALALLGLPLGLLWEMIAPRPRLVVVAGATQIADPESQVFITADGWFAVLTGSAGFVCGVVAYIWAVRPRAEGRHGPHEVALLLGLAVGGLAGAFGAWQAGHLVGLDTFQELVRTGRDGTELTGALDLRAYPAVFLWPLLGVLTFGAMEAADVVQRHVAPEPQEQEAEAGGPEGPSPDPAPATVAGAGTDAATDNGNGTGADDGADTGNGTATREATGKNAVRGTADGTEPADGRTPAEGPPTERAE